MKITDFQPTMVEYIFCFQREQWRHGTRGMRNGAQKELSATVGNRSTMRTLDINQTQQGKLQTLQLHAYTGAISVKEFRGSAPPALLSATYIFLGLVRSSP